MGSFELKPLGILKFDLFKILTRFNYLIFTIPILENQSILSTTYHTLIYKKTLIHLSLYLEFYKNIYLLYVNHGYTFKKRLFFII